LREDRLITVSALARIAGVPRRTLARQVASLNLKFVRRGDEKLYDIDALRSVLAKADVEQ
jgi:DNA-binding IclR family transcriptional regulator